MNDQAAERYVLAWGDHLRSLASEQNQFNRILCQLVKEVERDTRHKAFDRVQKLGNDICNNLWKETE